MKTIKLNQSKKEIILTLWEDLRVRDLRKINPIVAKHKQGEEIDMVIDIIKAFSEDKDIEKTIDDLTIEDFTQLSEEITSIMNTKKKIKK